MELPTIDVALRHPFTAIISGPTGSGKTRFVIDLLQSDYIQPTVENIIWCYGVWQTTFANLVDIEFVEGLPADISTLLDAQKRNLLIIDDLMNENGVAENVTKLFTKYSHHKNTSIIYLTQNLFPKRDRTISINAQYMVVFKNPRDSTQIATLSSQMFPGRSHFMKEAYNHAINIPYGYLFIDFKQTTDDRYRLRSNLFDIFPTLYLKRD